MNDPIDMVRQVTPTSEAPPELLERIRKDLVTMITESERNETEQPSRRRRWWAVPIAAAVVLASAAAGWAVVRGDTSTSTSLECPENTVVAAVSGDPVIDCAEIWRLIHGTQPPPMTAYDDGNGYVVVLLDSEAVPDGYVALEPGPHQDTALIELTAALDDAGTGLSSRCHDEAAARDVTQRVLTELGLTDWTIMVDQDRPLTGLTDCAYFIVDPDQQHVQLFSGRQPENFAEAEDPYATYATDLHDQLDADCIGLDPAADLARSLAETAGEVEVAGNRIVVAEALVIHSVEDPSATCTRANVTVGGALDVTLRGPAG